MISKESKFSPRHVRRGAAAGAAGCAVAVVWLGYCAIAGEITGKAPNWETLFGGPVLRETSPALFRKSLNFTWLAVAFCSVMTGVNFGFYRKLRDQLN